MQTRAVILTALLFGQGDAERTASAIANRMALGMQSTCCPSDPAPPPFLAYTRARTVRFNVAGGDHPPAVHRGIDSVIRDGLRWKDAPNASGPHKTLSNRFVRWPRLGVCQRSVAVLANQGPKPSRLMSDATHLKAHRTAAS